MFARFLFNSLLIILISSTPSLAAVYQYLDEQGNVVFTDRPVPGAVERKMREPSVIKFAPINVESEPKSQVDKSAVASPVAVEEKAKPYTRFVISRPVNDSSIQENTGTVVITFDINPPLQVKHGHKIKLSLDGVWDKAGYATSSITLKNVDRGTHTIQAAIVDKSGQKIKTTTNSVFHLHRFSKLFR